VNPDELHIILIKPKGKEPIGPGVQEPLTAQVESVDQSPIRAEDEPSGARSQVSGPTILLDPEATRSVGMQYSMAS
jgi:hypothetical protein